MRIIGATSLNTPEAEVVYNPLDGTVTFILADSDSYDENYFVDFANGTQWVKSSVTAVNTAVFNGVSVKKVVIGEDKTSATIEIYNACGEEKTVTVSEETGVITPKTVVIPAESVGSVSFSGENLDKAVWQISSDS